MRTAVGVLITALASNAIACVDAASFEPESVRDVSHFLRRLHELDELPRLGHASSELASTWDPAGGNALDGESYAGVDGDVNVLLDVEGPGVIHRISTGVLEDELDGTILELRLDGVLVLELPAVELFDPVASPFAGPLVFDGHYPTVRMPIPFAERAQLRLVSPEQRWGRFWQIGFSRYPADAPVETLGLPLDASAQAAFDEAGAAWLDALAGLTVPSEAPTVTRIETLEPGQSMTWSESGCGTLERLELALDPNWSAAWRDLEVRIRWDDATQPAVDLPAYRFLVGTDYGDDPFAVFDSLALGAEDGRAYLRLPMPYREAAEIELRNSGTVGFAFEVELAVWREPCGEDQTQPDEFGYFHAATSVAPAATDESPRSGPMDVPVHRVFERIGHGKVVGTGLRVYWPYPDLWWGEGDWQIWADLEFEAWPPSYHGTGTEEFYDGGWTRFDRRPLSGAVKQRPGLVTTYGFLLNDAFEFEDRIRMQVETLGLNVGNTAILDQHPDWVSTVYWYDELPG